VDLIFLAHNLKPHAASKALLRQRRRERTDEEKKQEQRMRAELWRRLGQRDFAPPYESTAAESPPGLARAMADVLAAHEKPKSWLPEFVPIVPCLLTHLLDTSMRPRRGRVGS
jgi:hypothetical protein